jgi:L-asparaginase II
LSVLLANVSRSGEVESQHFGHLIVVDAAGKIVFSLGDPRLVTYIRSAAKPFQAMPLYEDSVVEVFGLLEAEMAVVMSSHNGEPKHVDAVTTILRKIGCQPENLQCGVHPPLGAAVAKQLQERNEAPTVLQNNCSGKHAGMLAACVNRGWPLENYLSPEHPHQQRVQQTVARWAWIPKNELAVAVDGCSAPVFAMALFNMARMYASLVSSTEAVPQRIVQTFANHPDMIAGEERFDTDLIRATKGRVIAKIGAEGIQCLGITSPVPLGLALKISDGSHRAAPPVILAVLSKLGLISEAELEKLDSYRRVAVRNHRQIVTGFIEAAV